MPTRTSRKFLILLAATALTTLSGITLADSEHGGSENNNYRTTNGDALIVTVDDFAKFGYQDRYMPEKPSIQQFMKMTRMDEDSATYVLYGILGNKPDLRNWSAIMQSNDPASAAKNAYNQMIAVEPQASYIKAAMQRAAEAGNTTTTAGSNNDVNDPTPVDHDAVTFQNAAAVDAADPLGIKNVNGTGANLKAAMDSFMSNKQ